MSDTVIDLRRSKHREGPWFVGPHYKTDVESRSGHVCNTGLMRGPQAEWDATLIAAAPAMVQRLIYAERLLLQGQHDEALEQVQLGLAGNYEHD